MTGYDRAAASSVRAAVLAAALTLCVLTLPGGVLAQGQPPNAQLTGNADRGETLYTAVYKCYACHGYDAQSTDVRLKPLRFNQQAFITFVQSSPLPLMPAYPDAPAQDLADVHAYINAIPVDAPELDQVPLLKDILDRSLQTTPAD